MGVAGSGKSTVGRALAESLGCAFADGDDLHPASNIAKMASGQPLDDDDRWPWLAEVGRYLAEHPDGAVVAASSLKRAYRDAIRAVAPHAYFVHLAAEPDVLRSRLAAREGHFMGPAMLESQLRDLEPLGADEAGTVIDVGEAPPDLAAAEADMRVRADASDA